MAFVVADSWQVLGLGTKVVDYMIEICTDKRLDMICGVMLPDNHRGINIMKMVFTVEYTNGIAKATLNLREEELGVRSSTQKGIKKHKRNRRKQGDTK